MDASHQEISQIFKPDFTLHQSAKICEIRMYATENRYNHPVPPDRRPRAVWGEAERARSGSGE
jgi:hypothetical protein